MIVLARPVASSAAPLVVTILLLVIVSLPLAAQSLPPGSTPRGVVVAFLGETCTSDSTVDRALFAERLAGELAAVNPTTFRGTVPRDAKLRIDSIPDLPTEKGLRHVVAYTTLNARENRSLFLRRDSIWRLEALRQLPSPEERTSLERSMRTLDSSEAGYRLRRGDIEHLLLPDDSLAALLVSNLAAAEHTIGKLRGRRRWTRFALREVDLAKIDEYRELDDDVPAGEVVFYTIDRAQLARLKRDLGIRRIEHDLRYPKVIFMEGAAGASSHYGYLHSPGPADVPPVSPGEFFTIKPITRGWWLYKRMGAGSRGPGD